MIGQPLISKDRTLIPAMDYELLRREGLKHIESLAHRLWTDYNVHDPGITILEALCYAITELGYRSQFDMKELLAGATGQPFYTAKQILTVNPLTIPDYRKLLVDIEGVNNAWLQPSPVQEVPVYFNHDEDGLQFAATDEAIRFNGLYDVLLDLEVHDTFGDLNTGDVLVSNPAFKYSPMEEIPAGEFYLKVELPAVNQVEATLLTGELASATVVKDTAVPEGFLLKASADGAEPLTIPFRVTIPKHPAAGRITNEHIWQLLKKAPFAQEIFDIYLSKMKLAKAILDNASARLKAHRNLCEDFKSVTHIEAEEIAFCFDVDVAPGADIEQVQAEVFFLIEHYLNPPIQFYTLHALLDRGVPVDEIFDGVVLSHGFIDNAQLADTQLKQTIRTSDIINLLMDVPGVQGIRNFVMTKYDRNGQPVPGTIGLRWYMHISAGHKPVLATATSKILFFKNNIPFLANYQEARDTILLLHAQRNAVKLQATQEDLPVPDAAPRDTARYWPVQYDLPTVYGVGEHGLPAHADELRRGQRQQLRGYLLFFEQVLADFFAQLTHAKALFSTNDIKQTYFAQYLDPIHGVEEVVDEALKTIITQGADMASGQRDWRWLYEKRIDFEDRRGRFLDHLLARFGESFNDYALLLYRVNYEERTAEKIEASTLMQAKINTLKHYPEISRDRAKAYHYAPLSADGLPDESKLWDTDNVSGLEKRVGFLTGIADISRRYLYCIKQVTIHCEEANIGDEVTCTHYFGLTTRTGTRFQSPRFPTKAEAEAALASLWELSTDAGNYTYSSKKIKLKKASKVILESEETFATKKIANQVVNTLVAEITAGCNDPLGFHLVEHVLLRPRNTAFGLIQTCPDDAECRCGMDAYSYQASVILPYWPGHFDNMTFRTYFEQKIREEAPAHILLKVCWISNEQMRVFEIAYRNWVSALATFEYAGRQEADELRVANDQLVGILGQLHSVYPQATLHDCEESDIASNVVLLGKTVLGTFTTY
ncbi:hypothetical protein [Parapedobacter sp. DT-150]|uniref:hypothetical protein n=1 Tax=Parapedobacter sp. DT-150 TaxID=3396162 RepID=UPI003F1BDE7A